MSTQPNIPQTPMVNIQTGYITREWLYWMLNPQIQTIVVGSPIGVADGGTGLTSGTSGGILGFVGPQTMASSAELEANHIVLGGGEGLTPYSLTDIGTSTTVLHGNASGAPTFSAVDLTADVSEILPVSNGGTGVNSLAAHGVVIGNATAAVNITGTGTAGQILTSNGALADPTFQNPATSGTVTSVALSAPAEFTVSGSPVTSSGTLTFVKATQSANTVWAGPTTGAAAQPTFRALVTADVSNGMLPAAKLTATAASVLFGRGAGSGSGNGQEITLGTNLSMTGTVLNAAGSGTVTGPGSSTDRAIATWNGTAGTALRDNSTALISSTGDISAPSVLGSGVVAPSATVSGVQLHASALSIIDSTRSANGRIADWNWGTGTLSGRFVNDAYSAATSWINVIGTSASITSVTFPAGTFNVTGGSTFTGAMQVNNTLTTNNRIKTTASDFNSVGVGGIQCWKDSSPTKAVNIAMAIPGNAVTDDMIFSVFTGVAWQEKMRIANATGLVTTQNDVSVLGALTVAGTGTFNGNNVIGNASSDTLTIAPNAVTWSNNPTHSGNHVFSGNVSINGNPTLGDAAGDTVTVTGTPAGQVIGSTYTPTATAATNLDATPTVQQAQYMRVGATVTVSGTFSANPTAPGAASFELSLPVASNIGATEDCAGVAFSGAIAGQGAAVTGSIANNTAVVSWIAVDVTNQSWSFTFTYQII